MSPDSSSYQLRMAVPEDALCVGVLAMQVFLDTYATEGLRPDLAAEALENYSPAVFEGRIRAPGATFILAERAGHLIAFAEAAASSRAPHATAEGGLELVRLYVQRAAHRQGLGRRLLTEIETLALGARLPCVWLTVWSQNANARAFYAVHGYRDIGPTTYTFRDRSYENRIYRKTLTGAGGRGSAPS